MTLQHISMRLHKFQQEHPYNEYNSWNEIRYEENDKRVISYLDIADGIVPKMRRFGVE